MAEAVEFELADAVVEADDRTDYGEIRLRAFGRVDGEARCLVFALRGDTIRIISYRRAHAKEMLFMADKLPPVVFDDDNPEWTKADFVAARPAIDVLPPAVIAAFGTGKRGRPVGSTKPDAKKSITLRLDPDVIAGWRASGPGWQARMNDALRAAMAV